MSERVVANEFDLYGAFAAEREGLPDGWFAYGLSVSRDDVPEGFARVEGCVAPIGPRTGRPNWKKADKATERVVFVNRADMETWALERAERRNECRRCFGKKQVLHRWSRDNGSEYKTCPACDGTGAFTPTDSTLSNTAPTDTEAST